MDNYDLIKTFFSFTNSSCLENSYFQNYFYSSHCNYNTSVSKGNSTRILGKNGKLEALSEWVGDFP